ncbi:MAG: hypothetical protein Kow006_30130 [Gammaproteobacteria bacterium]
MKKLRGQQRKDAVLSEVVKCFVGGILKQWWVSSFFTTPTINGYKRYQPYSLAPDRPLRGRDNRGAMLRVVGGFGDSGTRIENRVGEPAANPYLYLASQIYAGLDNLHNRLEPSSPVDAPYDTPVTPLPSSLLDATFALKEDTGFREKLGDRFIDYLLHIKEAEINRFLTTVTDWEQREYFEIF